MSEKKKSQRIKVNKDITSTEVRLIGKDGDQMGVVTLTEALAAASQAKLDLVEISPTASPPVCKIMDFHKYKYDAKKKKALQKKAQTRIKVKEIKFRPGTDVGDYSIKLRSLLGFLDQGHKVKVSIRYRGREITHQELGIKLLERLETDVGPEAVIEQRPKMEGRQMLMVFAPNKKK